MTNIVVRQASDEEMHTCQQWALWESGDAELFEYSYEQDVQFIVQSGAAVIRSQLGHEVEIARGCHVTIGQGIDGKWDISAPVCNRYSYL